jgi:hypothetical protein
MVTPVHLHRAYPKSPNRNSGGFRSNKRTLSNRPRLMQKNDIEITVRELSTKGAISMLTTSFKNWIHENKLKLRDKGIQTEKVYESNGGLSQIGAYVDHSTDKYIGRIAVAEDRGIVDIELIEIELEIRVMIVHYEYQEQFHLDLVEPYLRILGYYRA